MSSATLAVAPFIMCAWHTPTIAPEQPWRLLAAMARHPDKVIVFLDVDCAVLGGLTPLWT